MSLSCLFSIQHVSIYESIKDVQMKQHSTMIINEQSQAGIIQPKSRANTNWHIDDYHNEFLSVHLITREL